VSDYLRGPASGAGFGRGYQKSALETRRSQGLRQFNQVGVHQKGRKALKMAMVRMV
jgi:hypothetical protein